INQERPQPSLAGKMAFCLAAINIGRVDEKGMVQLEAGQLELWRARTVATNKVCERCPFALNCGGGCAVAAEARNGGMYSNYCDAYEKRFKASVAEAYEEYTGKKNGTGANR